MIGIVDECGKALLDVRISSRLKGSWLGAVVDFVGCRFCRSRLPSGISRLAAT